MKKLVIMMMAFAAAQGTSASAGVFGDGLTRCLVNKADKDDQVILMRWFYATMAANPSVKDLAAVTPAQHEEQNRKGAALFERLLVVDCKAEALEAIKYEGGAAMEASFGMLGQVASQSLMSDPAVAAQLEQFQSLLSRDKLNGLLMEAGKPVPTTKPR